MYFECYACGNKWSEENAVRCPLCGSDNIENLDNDYQTDLELNAENLKKLSIVCYNINFFEFKEIFEKAINSENLHENYVLEKFEAFQREGLDWLLRLDNRTAQKFLNQLIQKI